ncbi:MAG: LytTR family DNA-binding domain-containing protein [Lachnospiraceae bacterium]|nr:LytTR family DNA-binding domain-containing protein [Lachnospiraceae bacterium]
MNLRVAIVEDELEAAQSLSRSLTDFCEKESIPVTIVHYADARVFLGEYKPIFDMVFMDIQMPEMDGMEASRQLRKKDPMVPLVFVTNMVQFALQGYDVNAMDFIVKPIQEQSFRMKLKRIVTTLSTKSDKGILIHVAGESVIISSSEICYIDVLNHDLTYHTLRGDFSCRGKLGEVEKELKDKWFFRCNHSALVNLKYITKIQGDDIEVHGTMIRISRSKKKQFLENFAEFMGMGGACFG